MNLYVLKIGQSKQLISTFIDTYNQGKKLSERLRGQHKALAGAMIYYYSQQLKKAQGAGVGIQEGQNLPVLRTNNEQLRKNLGVCSKTIRNLRKRLEKAGLITNSTTTGSKKAGEVYTGDFHGTNSSFGISLTPEILFISQIGQPDNVVENFSESYTPTPDFSATSGKSLPHTVSCVTSQVTSKLIKLEGVDFPQKTGIQSVEGKNNVDNLLKTSGKAQNPVENQQSEPIQDTQEPQEPDSGYARSKDNSGTTPPSCAAPPQEAPAFVSEAVAHLPEDIQKKISRIVDNIMSVAIINLYQGRWLSNEEKERGKACLAEYFAYSDPARFTAGANEVTSRIILAKKYIDRINKKGVVWTTPIPSVYFDFRRKKMFSSTKSWYKGHKAARAEINFKTALTKAVNFYLNSFDQDSKIPPIEAYRVVTQRLGKKSKRLLDAFNQQVIQIQNNSSCDQSAQS